MRVQCADIRLSVSRLLALDFLKVSGEDVACREFFAAQSGIHLELNNSTNAQFEKSRVSQEAEQ